LGKKLNRVKRKETSMLENKKSTSSIRPLGTFKYADAFLSKLINSIINIVFIACATGFFRQCAIKKD